MTQQPRVDQLLPVSAPEPDERLEQHWDYLYEPDARDVVDALAAEEFGEGASMEVTGLQALLGEWLGAIIGGQQKGLLFSCVIIALMMMLALRSVWLGLWSMLPNLLPLWVLGGCLAWVYREVDSDTLILAMLAIGVGVDDTIHFLMRYRTEMAKTSESAEAVRRTFQYAGRGIVMTTCVLCIGFSPCMLSDYYSTHILGTWLPFTLILALSADLLLLPAMANVGLIRLRTD